ncbi:hypothetical protein DWV52_08405 [Ruminococcaceae bacterium AF10-16]|jgi:hypothetical protein|nr:hypothetical protein DWV52_08405 [Ruminococcaceae bacterium AF10-16]
MDFIGQEPTIIEEIAHLISLKQEGRFWDFKKQWYELQTACRVDRSFKRNIRSNTAVPIPSATTNLLS